MPSSLKRAAARGGALALANALGLLALDVAWFGAEGLSTVGRFDVAFVLLLGLVAAPLALVEGWARPRGPLARGAAGLACGPLAALGLLMAHAQVSYLFAGLSGGSLQAAIGAQGQTFAGLPTVWSEARAVLVAFGAPFAAVALTRLFGLRLAGQLAVSLAASLLALALALRGFVGLPQVSWLVATPWLGPTAQSGLFLYPFALPLVLPLVDASLDRRVASSGTAHA
jgi:hypothetical protein